VFAILALAATGAAVAADKPAPRAAVLQDAIACRSVADDAKRLACYDRAVAALGEAEASHQVVVMDQAQVQETRRSLFGFSLPKLKIFGGGGGKGADEALAQIEAVVASTSRDADGRLIFRTEDGARWHQIDDRPSARIRQGMKATIKRAALGSYFATFTGAPSFRVRRDE